MNALAFHRVAKKLSEHNIPFVPWLITRLIYLLFNSFVPYECTIGEGTRLGYGGMGVVLHKNARIGKRCVIGQQVTLGSRAPFFSEELQVDVPVLGDDVYVACGAKILGAVTVGNQSVIAANSVVLKDVPANSVVAGMPARVVNNTDESYRAIQE